MEAAGSKSNLSRSFLSDLSESYLGLLLKGERRPASQLILDAVDDGVPIRDIYLEVFQPAQREVGRLWQENEITVADEHYCTAATQLTMSLLYGRMFDPDTEPRNRWPIVVASVEGELHELGARMVADLLELEGWNTAYLGANTPTEALVDSIRTRRTGLISLSVTIPQNLESLRNIIRLLRDDSALNEVPILVGGRALAEPPDSFRTLGADATAASALDALDVVEELMGRQPGGSGE